MSDRDVIIAEAYNVICSRSTLRSNIEVGREYQLVIYGDRWALFGEVHPIWWGATDGLEINQDKSSFMFDDYGFELPQYFSPCDDNRAVRDVMRHLWRINVW